MKKPEGLASKEAKKAAAIIKSGGVVIYPTDTVMGIGCNWDQVQSVKRVYDIKSRSQNVPLPILLSDTEQLKDFAVVTPLASDLTKRYWPGGLTIVLKNKSSSKKVGFRVPNSQTVTDIVRLAQTPIIGTSANFHGKHSVKNSKDLDPKLIKLVDYVVPGVCQGGVESTVLDATGKNPVIIRQGAVDPKSLTLTIETTKREEVAVALSDNWSKFKKRLIISQQTGSQALMPAIAKILKTNKCTVADLSSISVDTGPGSFTGTRIGVAVANVLGFSLHIPVNGKLGKIAVPTYQKSRFD